MQLPEPYQQQAQAGQPTPGQPTAPANDQAQKLIDAVNEALAAEQATSYRDLSPIPAVGSAPPCPSLAGPRWASEPRMPAPSCCPGEPRRSSSAVAPLS